jgi:hypothetical protein
VSLHDPSAVRDEYSSEAGLLARRAAYQNADSRFARVDERDASGTVSFPDRSWVLAYVQASTSFFEGATDVPEFVAPLVVRRAPVVFVAQT